MSDTPQTDAAEVLAWNGPFMGEPETQAWNCARTLERELAAERALVEQLREERDRLLVANAGMSESCARSDAHIERLEAEVERLQMQVDSMCDAEQLRQEREARKKAEAEVERLREEVKHSHNEVTELLIIAKAWALVWADKLSKESLAQFEALENGILARAARKATP